MKRSSTTVIEHCAKNHGLAPAYTKKIVEIAEVREAKGENFADATEGAIRQFLKDNVADLHKLQTRANTEVAKHHAGLLSDSTSLHGMLLQAMTSGESVNKNAVIAYLARKEGVSTADINKRINSQELDWKGIEEEVEAAVIDLAREIMDSKKSWDDKIADIIKLYQSQPNLAHRTGESKLMQQYSTPLPLGAIISEMLGIGKAQSVYEPTAGNGALLIGTNLDNVTANELDERRNEALKVLGVKTVLRQDAMEDVRQVKDKSQDVVVMNPPFGKAEAGVVFDEYELTKREHIIAANALDKMADDGKAAIIIGGHNFDSKGKMTEADQAFLNWLYNEYNVTHNVDIDGKLYGRQGATYPIRLITIEGRKEETTDDFIPNNSADPRAAEHGIGLENAKTFDEVRAILSSERGEQNGTERRGSVNNAEEQVVSTEAGGLSSESDAGTGRAGGSEDAGGRAGQSGVTSGKDTGGLAAGESGGSTESGGTGAGEHNNQQRRLKPQYEGMDEAALQVFIDTLGEDQVYLPAEPVKTASTKNKQSSGKPASTKKSAAPKTIAAPKVSTAPAAQKTAAQQVADIWADFSLKSDDAKIESMWQRTQPIIQQALDDALKKINLATAKVSDVVSNFVRQFINEVRAALQEVGKTPAQISGIFDSLAPRVTTFVNNSKDYIQKKIDAATAPKEVDALQAPYQQKSKGFSSGKLAPRNLADLMSTAIDNLIEEVGDIDNYVQGKLGYRTLDDMFGAFSGEQVDAIALAIHAIDKGVGIIVGDQTGVGKGRIASAVMMYAKSLGKKPIFVTEKPKLFSDINRDMEDIYATHPDAAMKPFIVGDDKNSNVVDMSDGENAGKTVYHYANGMKSPGKSKAGVQMPQEQRYQSVIADPAGTLKDFDYVAITYSQLSGDAAGTRRRMVAELAQDNIVIMDEAHNAAGESGIGDYFKSTILPTVKAGTYLSATYAKRPSAMALYSITELGKTGMSSQELEEAIVSGGVPMQQIISSLLAEGGQYIRRENDYTEMEKPTYSVDTSEETTVELEDKIDASTDILREIATFSRALNKYLKGPYANKINGNVRNKKDRVGVDSTNFASRVHNYIRQLMLSLKVDQMVEEGVKAMKEGRKPIFYIDNTMASFLDEYMEDNGLGIQGNKKGLPSEIGANFGEVMRRGLNRLLTISIKIPGKGTVKQEISLEELSPELQYMFEDINRQIDSYNIDVPVSPIDALISRLTERAKKEFGQNILVGEITGRSKAIDMTGETHHIVSRANTNRNDVVNGFNGNGTGPQFDVLIFNQAGATGLSLHPTTKTGDKRPRRMLVVQPSLNIDSYLQALGRIFRTGQLHKPEYVNLLLNLPAETRPSIIQNKKLASINANLAAKSEGIFTNMDIPDMDNHYGDVVVAQYLAQNGDLASQLNLDGVTEEEDDVSAGLFGKFSGRLVLLPVAQQKDVWADVKAAYEAHINYLDEMGENNLVAKDYDLKAKTRSEDTITDKTGEGIFQSAAVLEKVEANILKQQYTGAKINSLVDEVLDGKTPEQHAEEIAQEIRSKTQEYIAGLREQLVVPSENASEEEINAAENTNISINRKIAQAEQGMATMLGTILRQRMQVGNAFTVNVKGSTYLDGVIIGIKYNPGKAGSPVALSKLAITFAVNDSIQRVSIPLSKLTNMDTDYLGKGVPQGWENTTSTHSTETRYIMTGNLLKGMAKVKGHGNIVYYTDANGARKPGILMNQSAETRRFIEAMLTRKSVTAETLKAAIAEGKFYNSLPHFIRPSLDGFTSIRFDSNSGLWRLSIMANASHIYSDRELVRLTTQNRFDQGRGNDASQMHAYVPRENIAKFIDRLYEKTDGAISFDIPRVVVEGNGQQTTTQAAFSVGQKTGEAVDSEALQKAQEQFAGMFPEVPVKVVELAKDLPFPAPTDARGAYHNGTVYLVRSNIDNTTSAVATVLAHELTHHGLARLGERGKQLMNQIALTHSKDITDIMTRRGWKNTAENRLRAANELLAQYGETRLKPTLWQKVKDFLREVIAKVTGLPISNKVLEQALQEVKGPQQMEAAGQMQTAEAALSQQKDSSQNLDLRIQLSRELERLKNELFGKESDNERAINITQEGRRGNGQLQEDLDGARRSEAQAVFQSVSHGNEALILAGHADKMMALMDAGLSKGEAGIMFNNEVQYLGRQGEEYRAAITSLADNLRALGHNIPAKGVPFASAMLDAITAEKAIAAPEGNLNSLTLNEDGVLDTQFSLQSDQEQRKSLVQRALDATKNFINQDRPSLMGSVYMGLRYLTKGTIERRSEMARELHDRIAKFRGNEQTTEQILEFLTTKDADVNTMITDPDARQVAVEAKRAIIKIGEQLVDAGLMKQETFEKYEGEYLPRIYLKHLLGNEYASMQFTSGQGGKKLDLSYLKERKDIPEDVRNLILGQIKDPAYLVFMALSRSSRDIALSQWFQEIATHSDWVMPKMLVDWNIVEGQPKAIGTGLTYTMNEDGTVNVDVKKYTTRMEHFNVANYDELVALFNPSGDLQAAEALAGYINAKADDTVQKKGIVQYSKLSNGTFSIDIERRDEHIVSYDSLDINGPELIDAVGARRAKMIQEGKGRTKDGKYVTPFYLHKEAKRIEAMVDANLMDDPEGSMEIVKRMRRLANETMQKSGLRFNSDGELDSASLPDGWKQVPNSNKYGKLAGAVVRKEVYNDIVGTQVSINSDISAVQYLLGDHGLLWEAHRYWKMSKTSLNLPTHVTNMVSNVGLLHLSGIPVQHLIPMLYRASKELLTHGKYWRIGKKYGFTAATFNNEELKRVNVELQQLLSNTGEGKHPIHQMRALIGKLTNAAGDTYQFWEILAKTARLIYGMEHENLSAAQAALEAHAALFDYSDISSSMKWLRQSPFGAAFATFTIKSAGMLARGVKKDVTNIIKTMKPGDGFKEVASNRLLAGWASIAFTRKLAMYGILHKAAIAMICAAAGWDEDDYKKLMMTLPEFVRDKSHVLIFPFMQKDGEMAFIDLSRMAPYDPILSTAKDVAKGDIFKAITRDLGFLGTPALQAVSGLLTNVDANSNKQIIPKEIQPSWSEKMGARLLYLYNLSAPSMFGMSSETFNELAPKRFRTYGAAGYYSGVHGAVEKAYAAATGQVNPRTGAVVAYPGQVALSLLGANTTSVNPQLQRGQNLQSKAGAIDRLVGKTQLQLMNRNDLPLEPAAREQKIHELVAETQEKLKVMQEDIKKYKEESDFRKSALQR